MTRQFSVMLATVVISSLYAATAADAYVARPAARGEAVRTRENVREDRAAVATQQLRDDEDDDDFDEGNAD